MDEEFETHIRQIAGNTVYPPTPQVQGAPGTPNHKSQILRYAAVVFVLVGLIGAAVPDIRAAVTSFLQFGAVTIYLDGQDAEGEPLKLDDVFGATTLEAVRDAVGFDILLPPGEPPDRVFLQGDSMVILVWTSDDEVEAALYQVAGENWRIIKSAETIEETAVNQYPAYWVNNGHPVQFIEAGTLLASFVTGSVLVWEQNGVTYRLETSTGLEEARAFAEALTPYR